MFVSPFYYWFSLRAIWLLWGPKNKTVAQIHCPKATGSLECLARCVLLLNPVNVGHIKRSSILFLRTTLYNHWLVTLDTRTGYFIVYLYICILITSSRGICFFVALTLLSSDKSLVTNFLETEEKSVKKVAASFEAKVLKNKVTVIEKENQQDT